MTSFQHATVRGLKVFYREAGSKASPIMVLLHGFPSSSHMFRDLIPKLAEKFHVIAPDYVGFGYSDAPETDKFEYTFDNLAALIEELLFGVLGLKKFSIYVQDYGAPVGYRIASKHPDAIEGIVVQNGNAYVEGIGAAFDPMKPFWGESQCRNRAAGARSAQEGHHDLPIHTRHKGCFANQSGFVHDGSTFSGSVGQRRHSTEPASQLPIEPGALRGMAPVLSKQAAEDADCVGKERSFLHRRGCTSLLRDIPKAELHLLDTGHFALEDSCEFIAQEILMFFA